MGLCQNMCRCEMHVLYTPSCSKIQARYITLHLSCQSHWTHADFGSTEVVQCISNTMPRSFGIHQKVVMLVRDESISKKNRQNDKWCSHFKNKDAHSRKTVQTIENLFQADCFLQNANSPRLLPAPLWVLRSPSMSQTSFATWTGQPKRSPAEGTEKRKPAFPWWHLVAIKNIEILGHGEVTQHLHDFASTAVQ